MRYLVPLLVLASAAAGQRLSIRGTGFYLDEKPFPYTGVSFFNAIYNPEFNRSSEVRRQWIAKFGRYGINVFRIWAQWDNKRGFVDSCTECSLYGTEGLREDRVKTLEAILADTAAAGFAVELALFSQESWRENIRVPDKIAEGAVRELARRLKPHRNLIFQIWNEFDYRTAEFVKIIKAEDPDRLVTNSPGVAGVLLGTAEEMRLLDFFSPHTTRQGGGKPWLIGPAEISYLLKRWNKPVVDDEPARNGTPDFGGPKEATSPYDHILQIWEIWKLGGYVVYHHDMFQTGAGSPAVPPSGIPDPEFSPYHRLVFEFLAHRERYRARM